MNLIARPVAGGVEGQHGSIVSSTHGVNDPPRSRVASIMRTFLLLPLTLLALSATAAHAELRVPAYTAYFDPNPNGASVSEKSGITKWIDPALKVLWFGEIKSPGKLEC